MNSSDLYLLNLCDNIFLSWSFVNTFSLPVFLAVIVLALRSSSRSHTDVLTLHMAAVELVGVLGSGFCIYSSINLHHILSYAGENLLYMATLGQSLFHLLVCGFKMNY
uniref:Uncharacterized protein n=1 Tax=Knipowitschia caucasica TaxID=637954 RepID=A0AAV2KLI3_KNICA